MNKLTKSSLCFGFVLLSAMQSALADPTIMVPTNCDDEMSNPTIQRAKPPVGDFDFDRGAQRMPEHWQTGETQVTRHSSAKSSKMLLPYFGHPPRDISVLSIKPGVDLPMPETIPPIPTALDLPVSLDPPDNRPEPLRTSSGPEALKITNLVKEGKLGEAEQAAESLYRTDYFSTTNRDLLVSTCVGYGKSLQKQGKLPEAAKYYRAALYLDHNSEASDCLDSCLKEQGIDPRDYASRLLLAKNAEAASDFQTAIVEYLVLSRLKKTPETQVNLARCILASGQLVYGYAEFCKTVERTDWLPEQAKLMGSCHKQIADILFEYAYKAKESGRGTKGMERLLNSWIEYRRALSCIPDDPEIRKQLLKVADAALLIKPSACNYLASGSANILNGNSESATQCFEKVRKLDANYPGLSRACECVRDPAKK